MSEVKPKTKFKKLSYFLMEYGGGYSTYRIDRIEDVCSFTRMLTVSFFVALAKLIAGVFFGSLVIYAAFCVLIGIILLVLIPFSVDAGIALVTFLSFNPIPTLYVGAGGVVFGLLILTLYTDHQRKYKGTPIFPEYWPEALKPSDTVKEKKEPSKTRQLLSQMYASVKEKTCFRFDWNE